MKATIEIDCQNPEIVLDSIKPESNEIKKFTVVMESKEDGLVLGIDSESISGLLAGINSYLTLIKTSIKAMEESK